MFRFLVTTRASFTFPATNLKSSYSNSPVPAGANPLELRELRGEDCEITRDGYFKAPITIVGKTSRERRLESTSGHPLLSLTLKIWGGEQGHPLSAQGHICTSKGSWF